MDFGDILLNFSASGDDEAKKAVENVEKAVDKLGESSEEAAARLAALGGSGSDALKRIEESAAKTAARVKEVTESKGKGLTGTFIDDPIAPGGLKPADEATAIAGVTKHAEAVKKLRGELTLLRKEFPGVELAEKRVAQVNADLAKTYAAVGTNSEEVAGKTKKATGFFGQLSASIEGIDEKFNQIGLSFRGISILLGAGLATGIAGVVRIVQQLGKQVADFIGQERELARQTELSFGDGADKVARFANTTAGALGASRGEALKTANSLALVADQLRLTEEAATPFAIGLTAIAAQLSRARAGFKNTEEAGQALEAALAGDEKALVKLGVSLDNVASIAQERFGKLPGSLTPAEAAIVGLTAAADAAKDSIDKTGEVGKSAFQKLKDAVKDAVGDTSTASEKFRETQAIIEEIAERQAQHPNTFGIDPIVNAGIQKLHENISKLSQAQLLLLRAQAEQAGQKNVVKFIDEEIAKREKLKKAIDDQVAAALKNVDVQKLNEEAFLRNQQQIDQVIDAQRTLARAREDGARRVIEAEERVSRAFEDAARKREDLELRSARAAEDAIKRIRDAEIAFTDAQINSARRREDAEDRVFEARQRAAREVRGINEQIEDLDLDHARRVEDLQERIRESHKKSASAILEANIDIARALSFGTGQQFNDAQRALARAKEAQDENSSLANSQRDLQRENEDHAKDLARLQRELKEAQIDGVREVEKAVRDQQRAEVDAARDIQKAQEAINEARRQQTRALEDAQRAVRALRVENVRAVEDAIKGVQDAERERDRAIAEASRGFERLARDIGLTVNRLKELIETILTAQSFGPTVGPGGFFNIPGAQHGGLFHGPFFAGEFGMTELVVPRGGSNQVISHRELVKIFREAFGSGGSNGGNQFTIYESASPEATAAAVEARLMRGVNN